MATEYSGKLAEVQHPVPPVTSPSTFGQKDILDVVNLKASSPRQPEQNSQPQNARGFSLQGRLNAIEPPETKARSYQSLSQATIVLSVLCCFWPYNLLFLIAIFFMSKMVINRNEERDYLSARTASYILLGCNVFALIFGAMASLAIFITVFVYVIRAIIAANNDSSTSDDSSFLNPPFNNY